MQLLVDYFPLLLFFVAFKWQGIYVATGVAIVASVLQIAWIKWKRGKVAVVNWLSLVKVRTTLIGGKDKMLVWNDLEADEKIKVYDKGVQITSGESVHDLLVNYRSGDVWAPRVELAEALKVELNYFVDCIIKDQTPLNDGYAGLRVVKLLEAAELSLKGRGSLVSL